MTDLRCRYVVLLGRELTRAQAARGRAGELTLGNGAPIGAVAKAQLSIPRLRKETGALCQFNPEPISVARLVGVMPRRKRGAKWPPIAFTF